MSTQPFSALENPKPFTTEAHREVSTDRSVCATRSESRSLLDEPWKVTLIPAEEPVGEDPHAARSLPWRVGDVTRLKDDSPKGMMEYIATHSTGWWHEMAERALRDTEKAERMAREQGWQNGQYWALEVDAEAKQKLLDAEEAKRAREEEARAREGAEKQAFIQRQMELLEKAGRAPRCEYQYTDGRGCKSPQVKGERWCHGHAKMMSYRPEKLEILPMEDEQAVMVNLYRVTNSLLAGRITEKVAGLTLWSIAIGMPGARKLSPQRARRAQRKKSTHRGGAETRRKTKKVLPRIGADARGSERRVSRESRHAGTRSTRKSANHTGANSGVTQRKSFKSGVDAGSRGLPKMPKLPKIAESEKQKFSVSQRLRGEIELGAREHSSASPCLSGEIESRGEIKPARGGEIASFQAGD
jgi:hypothetical protein